MQSVSQKWKDNQNSRLVSESFIEISLDLTDPLATADASATDNGSTSFSNTEKIVGTDEADIISYATLEQNLWLLDGKLNILPQSQSGDSSLGETGYVSNIMSDENGVFPSSPTITISFSKVHEEYVSGINVTWSTSHGDYPTDFTVTAYNGNTVVAEKVVSGNKDVVTPVLFDIVNYNKVVIVIHKWCAPYRRARVEDILLGVKKVYTKSDLFSFSYTQEADVISASLPMSKISFSLDNSKNTYNPHNKEGLNKYLNRQQGINVRYGYKTDDTIEWIKGGKFYLSNWVAKQNSNKADFEAGDIFGELTNVFYHESYKGDEISLYDLAVKVLTYANLPVMEDGGVRWEIDESLKNIYTTGTTHGYTCAESLQIIANAACCGLCQNKDGRIQIKAMEIPDDADIDYSISSNNSYSKPETSLEQPVKQITVQEYSYVLVDSSGEVLTADPNTYAPAQRTQIVRVNNYTEFELGVSYKIDYESDKLWYSLDNTNLQHPNIEPSSHYTIVSYPTFALVTRKDDYNTGMYVSGFEISKTTISHIISVSSSGEEVIVDNPLITSKERALIVGEWVKSYLQGGCIQQVSWRADPRLDVLDVVKNNDAFSDHKLMMTKIEYAYNGAFKGSGEGRVI